MNDEPIETENVVNNSGVLGPNAATEGPAGTLSLQLVASPPNVEPPVVLHGFYNIDAARAGRVDDLPAAIRAVIVLRETGAVYAPQMMNDDVIPPLYRADALPTIVQDNAPEGALGPSELGHFTADLQVMTGLPTAAATLDGFLWLEDVSSDMTSVFKPASDPAAELPMTSGVASEMSSTTTTASVDEPTLSLDATTGHLTGTAPGPRVSVIAMSLPQQQIGYTVLSLNNAEGLSFDVPIAALLPGAQPGSRILAFAVANGQKSQIADGNWAQ